MQRLKRIVIFGAALVAVTLGVIMSGIWFTSKCSDVASASKYDVAIILGGGMEPDGRLLESSIGRVKAGAALYLNGVVNRIHTTGGAFETNGPASGAQMARLAQTFGVPADKITHEDASQSTLQNALFSKPYIHDNDQTILVTEGFHLVRSWLSFRWAGIEITAMCHNAGLRQSGDDHDGGPIVMLAREVLAFWFNIARAGIWTGADALGLSGPRLDAILH